MGSYNLKQFRKKMSKGEYMKLSELEVIVDKWLQRQKMADDVEYLRDQGGIDWLINGLKTDVETGIDPNSVETRRMIFGTGKVEQVPPKGILELFCEA